MKGKIIWFIVCGMSTVQCMKHNEKEMKEVVIAISTAESLEEICKKDIQSSDPYGATVYSIEPSCMAEYQRKKLHISGIPTAREIDFYSNNKDQLFFIIETERMLQKKKEEAECVGQIQSVCAFYAQSINDTIQGNERECIDVNARIKKFRAYCGGFGGLCVLISIGIFSGMHFLPLCTH